MSTQAPLVSTLVAMFDSYFGSQSPAHKNGPLADEVGNQICSSLLPKQGSLQGKFLPLGVLKSILSQNMIYMILQEIFDGSPSELEKLSLVIRVQKPSLRIFATLILIKQANRIKQFLEHGVDDEQLPLPFDTEAAIFHKWRLSHVHDFCEKQYLVTAPLFDFTELQHSEWTKERRMPFLEPLEWKSGGAHGEIAKVKIHSDHLCWRADLSSEIENGCFAVKRFRARDATEFGQERDALLHFSQPRNWHEHLIKLLLSYKVEDELYMIFPWANGNLAEFWKNHPSRPESKQHWIWLILQCLGMSDGLCKVHGESLAPLEYLQTRNTNQADNRNRGRHGDIKPENILYFGDKGPSDCRLVIADFTLMRFHSLGTVRKTQANKVAFSRAYCPPEVEFGEEGSVDQKYDVWTLGCVYLEFVTWYLFGYDAIRKDTLKTASVNGESFYSMRQKDYTRYCDSTSRFFNHRPGFNPTVKESVYKWIAVLRGNEHCSNAMHDFLTLIGKHMLVLLPDERYSMIEVRDELKRIATECQKDGDYCYTGNPKRSSASLLPHLLTLARKKVPL